MGLGNGFTVGWYEREGGKKMASCLHLSEPEWGSLVKRMMYVIGEVKKMSGLQGGPLCSYVSNLTEQISLLGFLELSQCIWSIRKDQCSLYPFLCGMSTYVLFSQIRCIFTLTSLLLSGRVVTKSCIVTFVRCSHSAGGLVFTDSRRQTGPFPAVWENQALISDPVVVAHSTEYGWRQQIPQSTWLLVTEGRAFNTCSFWNLKIWFQITFK